MENGVTGVITKHVQKHVEVHHKNEQENVTTQHQLTVAFHVQDLTKIHKLADLLHVQSTETGPNGLHMDHAANLAQVDKKLGLDHALAQHQNTMELLVQEVHLKLHHATHKTAQLMPNGAAGVDTEVVQRLVTLEHKQDQDHAVVIDTVERKLAQDQALQAEAVMSMFDAHIGLVT